MAAPLLIAGASYAGLQVAASAREAGYAGRIVMVGDEVHLPYQRPPLSKGLLTGKTDAAQLTMRPQAFFDEQGIELCLGRRITGWDRGQREVLLDDGGRMVHGPLVIATGARPRMLDVPGARLQGVMPLRTLDDALRLREAVPGATAVCVIGGGFIGLEVASALAAQGLRVTVVEAQARLLARAFTPAMSRYVQQVHEAHGVTVRCGRSVRAVRGEGHVHAVELDDGERIDCTLVIVGIGVLPNTEWAVRAGLEADATGGLTVDALGRTDVPGVFAAGDCAAMASPYAPVPGQPVRLESIQAANDGARAIASALVDRPMPCEAVPWFWSEQHGLKLQMAGLGDARDDLVVRGDMAAHKFTAFHLREGRVVAAHSVNRPAEHLLARKLVGARVRLAAEAVADEGFDLKAVLASAA